MSLPETEIGRIMPDGNYLSWARLCGAVAPIGESECRLN